MFEIPLFIRKSTLRLPHRPNLPVIMIGPGTGFAPFRGFIQDRHTVREQGCAPFGILCNIHYGGEIFCHYFT